MTDGWANAGSVSVLDALVLSRLLVCLTISRYTQGEVTSQSLWSRYDRHFVGITRHHALS